MVGIVNSRRGPASKPSGYANVTVAIYGVAEDHSRDHSGIEHQRAASGRPVSYFNSPPQQPSRLRGRKSFTTPSICGEVQLYVVPTLVGGGNRALSDGVRVDLELVEEHRFPGGVVYLRYRTA